MSMPAMDKCFLTTIMMVQKKWHLLTNLLHLHHTSPEDFNCDLNKRVTMGWISFCRRILSFFAFVFSRHRLLSFKYRKVESSNTSHLEAHVPPVDLHWFFEISIRTEKKFQLELKKKFSYNLNFTLIEYWANIHEDENNCQCSV